MRVCVQLADVIHMPIDYICIHIDSTPGRPGDADNRTQPAWSFNISAVFEQQVYYIGFMAGLLVNSTGESTCVFTDVSSSNAAEIHGLFYALCGYFNVAL